jgi:hypothetical protein
MPQTKTPAGAGVLRLLNVESYALDLFLPLAAKSDQPNAEHRKGGKLWN